MVVSLLLLFILNSIISSLAIRTTFFYVSEQGDEYASMSGKIASEVAVGSVVRVTVFNGAGRRTLNDVFTGKVPCPLHDHPETVWPDSASRLAHLDTLDSDGYHTITLTPEQILNSRNLEFKESMTALGLIECSSFSSSRNCFQILPLDTNFLSNKNGFWGDTLTTAYYNQIYASETLSPGSMHICAGSPRDCRGVDSRETPNPKNLACWYAARQLMTDFPTGINSNGWRFDFMMADFPFTTTDPTSGSVLSAAEAQDKIDAHYGTVRSKPLTTSISAYDSQKSLSGKAYGKFDTAAGRYAIGLHLYPQQYASAAQNSHIYEEGITEYTAAELSEKWCGLSDPNVPAVAPTTKTGVVMPGPVLSGGAIAAIVICSLLFLCGCCFFWVACGASCVAAIAWPKVDSVKFID